MAAAKAGDRVEIVTREVTAEDQKSGMYYTYFGGLTGTVDRIYDDGAACVDIDLESLSEDSRERHTQMQEIQRQRWMESLSGEVRNRLTPEQKQLKISYKLLVRSQDLAPLKGGAPGASADRKKAAQPKPSDEGTAPPDDPAPQSTGQASQQPDDADRSKKAAEQSRKTEAELSEAEEAHLREIQSRME